MADYKVTDTELIAVANKIRTKGGTQAQLEWPSGYMTAIDNISGGGGGGTISVDVFVDNKNTTSDTGLSASITTNDNYDYVILVAFIANSGSYVAPILNASGNVNIIQDQIVNNFYYTKPYTILAHAENVPQNTVFTASSQSNSASATLYLFGIKST